MVILGPTEEGWTRPKKYVVRLSHLERRRRRAVEAIAGGESPEVVARTLGIARASVYRWLKRSERTDGSAAKPHPGSARLLSPKQHQCLETLLVQGAKAHGRSTELWTWARIAASIQRHFGITYHRDPVGRTLRERSNRTPQKPRRRARERNDEAIEYFESAISCIALSPKPVD